MSLANPVTGKQQAAGYQQGTAHKIHVLMECIKR